MLAIQSADSDRVVISSRIVGQLFIRLSMYKEAEEILLKTIPLASRSNLKNDYKKILSNLGIAYIFQAKYDKALLINLEVLNLREVDKEYNEVSLILNNLGLLYLNLEIFRGPLSFIAKQSM
jgi:tetratricopeptide (TPR) repeat protein